MGLMTAMPAHPVAAIPLEASFAELFATAAAFPSVQPSVTSATVHVYDFGFSTGGASQPDLKPTIHVGDTVHWTFDSAFHSVTAASSQSESFDSGVQFSVGATFDHTFTHAGTFNYYCTIHGFDSGNGQVGGMASFVTVLAVPEPATLAALSLMPALLRRRRRA